MFEKKTSRVRFHQVAALARHDQVRVHMSGPGFEDWDSRLSPVENVRRITVQGEDPDIVLTYKVGGLRGCHAPVAISYNEACDQPDVRNEIADTGASLVILHHHNDLVNLSDLYQRGIRLVHIPHSADKRVYRDYGEDKSVDVLVCGNLNNQLYALRYRLMRLAVKYFAKRGYRVKVLPHPGYTLPPREGTYVGEDFARWLNRAKVVFTCSMIYKYALAKYTEIAMCRSLPVGDMPDECPPCREAFSQMILPVERWMTDEEICRTVEDVLDNPEELARRTHKAHEIATERFGMEHYADRFVYAVRDFLAERPTPRKPIAPATAPGTRVVFAFADQVSEAEGRVLTPDATYTVARTVVHRAPAVVWLCEVPGVPFPSTAFREEQTP